MSELAIQTQNLRKVFRSNVAVQKLTLGVRRGEVFGFLGPNGAGKTTSIKMLLGLVAPTAGSASILGQPLGDCAIRARIGFLPEHFRFHDWLTAAELLRFHGRLYGLPDGPLRKRIPMLLELVGLSSNAAKPLKTFSKGMLQRAGLAQALLNEPDLIILDEPTSGLDPGGRRLVREIINDQRARGTTVFLSSHLLGEVEATCDRVAFIKDGVLQEIADLHSLAKGEGAVKINVRNINSEIVSGLARWTRTIRWEEPILRLDLANDGYLPEIIQYLVANDAQIFSVIPERHSLEEMFLRIVGPEGGL